MALRGELIVARLSLTSALLLAGTGLMLGSCTQAETPAQAQGAPQGPAPVTVAQPLARDIIDWDEYSGYFSAVDTVQVRPRVSGYLQTVMFRDGDIVRQGQLLAQIDPRPFQAEVARAQADLARAQAELTLARRQIDRIRPLLPKGSSRSVSSTRNWPPCRARRPMSPPLRR
jgi:multidrug efflux pump subunit AcrA (membrane-fusion protein)